MNKQNNTDWKDCEREDLKYIPIMAKHGYKPKFHSTDKMFKRIIPEFVPHHPVSFENGNKVVWEAGTNNSHGIIMYWVSADLIDGYYRNHKKHENLEGFLKGEEITDLYAMQQRQINS